MTRKPTRSAVVRTLPRQVEGLEGWVSAMAVALLGEAPRQFLVAELPERTVAIAANLNAEGLGALPTLLNAGDRIKHEDVSVERIVLGLCGLDPESELRQVGAGDQRAFELWVDRRPPEAGNPVNLCYARAERVDIANSVKGTDLTSYLKVFGKGSWSPHEDPQCRRWLWEGYDVVEFRLAGNTTKAQWRLLETVLPGRHASNGWLRNEATERWYADDAQIARVVHQIHTLVTSQAPVGYVVTPTSIELVGHLTIDLEEMAILITGRGRKIALEADTLARLARALANDEILAVRARGAVDGL